MSFPLPQTPSVPDPLLRRLLADGERFRDSLPPALRAHCREQYGIDLAGEYAGAPIPIPFGKASGQLSLNIRQVERDVEAGLGFIVLKTLIAEDEEGRRSMAAWAVPETRMRVERVTGSDGTPGWTVSWKGRGWSESLESYLQLFRQALEIAQPRGVRIAPSVKYHLPGAGEGDFLVGEYRHTTRMLQEVWSAAAAGPMPLEKDLSPTLAGDARSREQEQILLWLRAVPDLIRRSATDAGIILGVKLMNACFDDEFQLAMLRAAFEEPQTPPDFLIYANRLFDPQGSFEGSAGTAYGGPDLSARNLRVLGELLRRRDQLRRSVPPLSATGDILTGRKALEYGLLGAASCQMHTLFQLPETEFASRSRNRAEAALHHLLFHPETGLLAWLLHLADAAGRPVHWLDLPELGAAVTTGAGYSPMAHPLSPDA